jgi:hypothetical protein
MTKTRVLGPVLLFLAACSSTDGGGDRYPASSGRRVPLHAGNGSDDRDDREQRGGRDRDEDRSGCDMDTLNRVEIGEGYTAADVLTRIKGNGTFSGSYQQVLTQNKYNQYIPAYKLYLDRDRRVLSKWFRGSAPGTANSDIFEAARDSVPFTHAIDFVNGNRTMAVMQNQYELGHRMAAILAVMFATADKSDCVRYVRKYANQLLPDADLALLDQINYREMAARRADGTLPEVFGKVADRRIKIRSEMESIDKSIANKERQNARALERLGGQMKSTYRDLQRSLMDIGPCRDQVEIFGGPALAGNSLPKEQVDRMVATCQEHLEARLDEFHNDQLATDADLKMQQTRKTENEAKLEKAIEKGDSRAIRRIESAIEQNDIKIVAAEKKLAKLAERSKLYSESLELLINDETSSITLRRDALEDLISQHETRTSGELFKEDQQRLQRLRNDLKATSTDYLGLGFFGGFAADGRERVLGR